MRPETEHLCKLLEQAKGAFSNPTFEQTAWKCSLRSRNSRLTIDEVGNTQPAVINVNVGSTITLQEIDDPDLLPAPTSGRYQATSIEADAKWLNLVDGDKYAGEELIAAAVATLKDYVDNEE